MLSTAVRRLGRRGRLPGALALLRPLHASSQALASAAEPEPVPLSKLKDQFLNATSSTYLEELEERYRSNPKSVDKSWASFFHSMGKHGSLDGAPSLGFARTRLAAAPPPARRRRQRQEPAHWLIGC